MIGKPKLPQNIATKSAMKMTLLSTKSDSRLIMEANCRSSRSAPPRQRQANSASASRVIAAQNASMGKPTSLRAKLCTLSMTPLRVANVPNITAEKAAMTSSIFHNFSMPRFSWIITLWMKAVPTSQGKNAAFSTGSQPQ